MKPKDAFVGVIDLFAILLPGAVLTFVAQRVLSPLALMVDASVLSPFKLEHEAGWVAFFAASYLLGHLLFSASAKLDTLYDKEREDHKPALTLLATQVRDRYLDRAKKWLGTKPTDPKRDRPAPRHWVWLVGLLALCKWKWTQKPPKPNETQEAINVFKTAIAILEIEHPAALVAIRRLEADSKFFRSAVLLFLLLSLVLAGGAVGALIAHGCGIELNASRVIIDVVSAAVCVLLLRPCYARYCEQREKAVALAYQLVVVLQAGPSATHTD